MTLAECREIVKKLKYCNFHCHSGDSNFAGKDSPVLVSDYINRIKELKHTAYASTEHGISYGWVEKYLACEKEGLKFIFGVEGYVAEENSKKTHHILFLAKSKEGMISINRAMNEAVRTNTIKRRPVLTVDMILRHMNPEQVICTNACVFGIMREESGYIISQMIQFFKKNFVLEVGSHIAFKQIEMNKRIKALAKISGCRMMVGIDSHYIYPEQSKLRDDLIEDIGGMHYKNNEEDDYGWFNDYPDTEEVFERLIKQSIWTPDEALQLIRNTNMVDLFEDIVLDKSFDIPTIYPELTMRERQMKLLELISSRFDKYVKDNNIKDTTKYEEEIKKELIEWYSSGMTDYPLTSNAIVELGLKKGGILTTTGRGSCSSYITNMLLGFTTVDRLKVKVPLLMPRFMTADKIINSHSVPDIDNNVADIQPFIEAQEEILGQAHSAPLMAIGKLQAKSAFKLMCKNEHIPVDIQNEMSNKISQYERAMTYASDEEREHIHLADYLDSQELYDLYKKGENYFGLPSDIKRHASAFCISSENIRELFGECLTPAKDIVLNLEGKYMDELGLVKLDWLIVKVVEIIDVVYKKIGIPTPTAAELENLVKNSDKTWNIYTQGITCCVNQIEGSATKLKCMKFQPKTIEELCAFIAAVRPGFTSYYKRFESRQHLDYSLPQLDEILQGKYLSSSWMLYQEQIMLILAWLGFEMKVTYDIMKAISKKKIKVIAKAKEKFLTRGTEEFIKNGFSPEEADKAIHNIWKVLEDSSKYSFNASHSYCMALDSLYIAYAKANYPEQTFEALIDFFSKKKIFNKVSSLKNEAKNFFGIEVAPFKFRQDNRKAHTENKVLYQALSCIKSIGATAGEEIFQFRNFQGSFVDLFSIMTEKGVSPSTIKTLAYIDYFSEFGEVSDLIWICDNFKVKKQITHKGLEKICDENNPVLLYSYDDILQMLLEVEDRHTAKTIYFKQNKDFFTILSKCVRIEPMTELEKKYHQVRLLGVVTDNSKAIIGKVVKFMEKKGRRSILLSDAKTNIETWYTLNNMCSAAKNDIIYAAEATAKVMNYKSGPRTFYSFDNAMNLTRIFKKGK